MKRRMICLIVVLAAVLGGCSWMDGTYVSVTPHHEQLSEAQTGTLFAENYSQLRQLMTELTEAGTESAVIYVPDYDQTQLEQGMENAVRYISTVLPVGAYAIERVDYEIGVSSGQPAVSVNITYLHGRSEIRMIRKVKDMDIARERIETALENCDASLVLYVEEYAAMDLEQLVEDYASENPDAVMEVPQLSVGFYPEQGPSRVLELKFTYQTSRDALRSMQNQVQRVFASASLYINQEDADVQKYAQLFSFLTERFDYQIETSITPSYSLLCHGVGDSRTFAMVYATMCRQADLECQVVTGTKNGEAWYWNLICEDGIYYHADLLESREAGQLVKLSDSQMAGYVWDYSAYPAAGGMEPAATEATE
ncbi:MAG: transglutaminase domain-containing protein [Ruminococcaceae bacterium]|nr:transglutaminase domain-containing protein [Oscillospiraceae bacterium]